MSDWMEAVPEYDSTHCRHKTVGGKGIVGHLIAGRWYPKRVRRARGRKRKDAHLGWSR